MGELTTKIIFLDFDGVLNSVMWAASRPGDEQNSLHGLDSAAVDRLAALVQVTDAKIVVTSTWRKSRDVEQLRAVLKQYGYPGEPPVIGKTPVLWRDADGNAKVRGDEIQQWLDEHPKVESFIIIDDDSDMAHLMPRLLKTGSCCGLRDWHIDDAVRLFGRKFPDSRQQPTEKK